MPKGFQKIQRPISDNEVLVGTAVFYGPYTEYGTVRADAQPFLRPALDLAKGKAVVIVKRESKYHFKQYLLEHDAYKRMRAGEG